MPLTLSNLTTLVMFSMGLALMAMARVLSDMRLSSVVLGLHAFHLRPEQLQLTGTLQDDLVEQFEHHTDPRVCYTKIKQEESDLLAFSFDLQEQVLSPEQVLLLGRQTHESRALVYSSKTLQDIREDLVSLRHSAHAEVITLYKTHRNFIRGIYSRYLTLVSSSPTLHPTEQQVLAQLMDDNERHYQEANLTVHAMASTDVVGGTELSTMLNVNREMHHALKNLFLALGLE